MISPAIAPRRSPSGWRLGWRLGRELGFSPGSDLDSGLDMAAWSRWRARSITSAASRRIPIRLPNSASGRRDRILARGFDRRDRPLDPRCAGREHECGLAAFPARSQHGTFDGLRTSELHGGARHACQHESDCERLQARSWDRHARAPSRIGRTLGPALVLPYEGHHNSAVFSGYERSSGGDFSLTWSAAIMGGFTTRADVHASASRCACYAQPTYQQARM